MRSGSSVSGFVGAHEDYIHEEYHATRGFIEMTLAESPRKAVSYELVTILLSQIEGYLLQSIYGAPESEIPEIVSDAKRRLGVKGP